MNSILSDSNGTPLTGVIRLSVTIGLLLGLLPLPVGAVASANAAVRIVGPAGLVRAGETLTVELQLDSRGQRINAAEIGLRYPVDRLEVRYVGRENSIFMLWPAPPEWTTTSGLVTLSAGRPGGLFALNASVATVYFRVLQSGPASLTIDPNRTAVYLNDGQGTRVPVDPAQLDLNIASDLVPGIILISTTHPTPAYWSHGRTAHVGWSVEPETEYSYRFDPDAGAVPDDTPASQVGSVEYTGLADGAYYFTIKQRARGGPWSNLTQRRFLMDGTPPDPFQLELLPASALGGAQVLAWTAFDAASGVAGAALQVNGQSRVTVVSPTPTEPDWRGRVATVVVTDAAGNQTSASLRLPGQSGLPAIGWWLAGAAAAGLLALVGRKEWRRLRSPGA